MQTNFTRAIEEQVNNYVENDEHKILFIWGPRRSGKTTLLEILAERLSLRIFNFDLQSDQEKFQPREEVLARLASEAQIILIDEVQNYPESTVSLKILHDRYKVKIIATGSSELRQQSKDFDSLAGRFTQLYCLPLSIEEIITQVKPAKYEEPELKKTLSTSLQIFGAYPEINADSSLSEATKISILQNILDSYVLKDVINIYELKNLKLAKDILTKVALQIGSEVSVREIASSLGASHSTVSDYLEIFIKNYILIALPSFKTNMRRAVSENRKLYFYDLGVRNILIQDFRDLDLRQDKGAVFENLVIAELEKLKKISGAKINTYFYREYGGKEIDLIVEDYKKNYTTVEIKLKGGEIRKIFPLKNEALVLTSENYVEQLSKLLRQKQL